MMELPDTKYKINVKNFTEVFKVSTLIGQGGENNKMSKDKKSIIKNEPQREFKHWFRHR